MKMRTILIPFVLFLLSGHVGELQAATAKVIAQCDFEGPHQKNRQGDTIQKGWDNNYTFGIKDIRIGIDAGATGKSQKIDIRGIGSGACQFSWSDIALKNGHYYRVRFKAKAEGLEGPLRVEIRQLIQPWSPFFQPKSFTLTDQWQEYSLGGTARTDVNRDIAVVFSCGAIGRIWLDDFIVEEFTESPEPATKADIPEQQGNLFPRSSFEGRRDWLWTSGLYADAAGEWEDPQIYRAEGGKFGRHCLALPAAKTPKSQQFVRSYRIPIAPGHCYTFSVWMKAASPDVDIQLHLHNQHQGVAMQGFRLTTDWKRYMLTTSTIPPDSLYLYAGIHLVPTAAANTIYADGFQLEVGDRATDYKPRFPFELHAVMNADGLNLRYWGEKSPVKLLAASANEKSREKLTVLARLVAFPDRECWKKKLDLNADEEFDLDLQPGRNGLFRLELEAEDPTLAAPQEMLFAVLPPPRPTGAESLFGTHITVRPFFIEYAKRIGMKWQRLHDGSQITKWRFIEPQPGEYRYLDEPVDALKAAGFQLLGLPDGPPAWAKRAPGGKENVIDLEAFSRHCTNLARHYRGKIDYWEVWNEPWITGFFNGTPVQYGEVLRTAAAALREGNPDVKILGFCDDLTHTGYTQSVPIAGRDLIDILSVHGYFYNLTGGGTIGAKAEVDQHRTLFTKQKLEGFWNSEGGNAELGSNCFYRFLADDDINLRAAAFGSRVWVEQRHAGVDKLFFYTMHQSDSIMYFGGFNLLIGFDRSITPAATSTAVCAWAIDGLLPQKMLSKPGVVQRFFTGKDRTCCVVFNDGGVPGRRSFNVGAIPRDWQVVDVMGNDPRLDGHQSLPIEMAPIFIIAPADKGPELVRICRNSVAPMVKSGKK